MTRADLDWVDARCARSLTRGACACACPVLAMEGQGGTKTSE